MREFAKRKGERHGRLERRLGEEKKEKKKR